MNQRKRCRGKCIQLCRLFRPPVPQREPAESDRPFTDPEPPLASTPPRPQGILFRPDPVPTGRSGAAAPFPRPSARTRT